MNITSSIFDLISSAADFIWGPQMLIFILGSGVYFSIRLKFIQFTQFNKAVFSIKKSLTKEGEGNISPYQALMAALSGIVGNGNIAGVATAIVMGGPGAIFWMWVSALILMATMYSESLLGFAFRRKDPDGTYLGGPMVYIEKGLKWKWLAIAFAFAMAFKTLISTTSIQSNSMSIVVENQFGISQIVTCAVIGILTWVVVIGGLKKLAKTTQFLTPFMTAAYIIISFAVIIINYDLLLPAFELIINSAFSTTSATGGFAGATVLMAIRYGAARGAYSNEAGTGSVSILHATAQTDNPVRQSLISMMGVFIDTIIICTLTALVILISGFWTADLNSTALTAQSFADSIPSGNFMVLAASLLFGYSTLITWCFYGEQCAAYIFGDNIKKIYRWLFCITIMLGAVNDAEKIWSLGDLLNGITVIINLIGIAALSPLVIKLTKEKINSV